MAVKTHRAGSIKALRASVERKGGGNDAFLQRIPADDSLNVRFMTEPEEWQSYFEHYDQVMRYYPCSDNCPGCTEGNRPSQRYLANVLDIQNDRVVPLVLPKTLVTKLLNSYEKYDTLTDRDYELIRVGSGMDTDYDRAPEAPGRRPTKGHSLLDLEEVLENQLKRAFEDEDSDDEDPAPVKSKKATVKPIKKQPVVEEEDDDEEAAAVEVPPDEELEEMSLRELRDFAKLEMKIDAADIRGLDQDSIIDLIKTRANAATEESGPEPDDEEAAEDDAKGNDEDDESDSEELTEEDIRAMSLAELRKLCGDLEIAFKRTDGKALLVKKILDSAPDDDEDEPPF